jgi:hypothetical protein
LTAKIALGLLSCVCLAACGGNQPAPQAQPPAAKPPAAQAPAAQAPAAGAPAAEAPGAAAAPAAAAPASEFGVLECDNYIAKFTACVDSKVPEAGRAAVRQGLDQMKASWKQLASNPDSRKGLAQACDQALDAAKTSMQAYGCTW